MDVMEKALENSTFAALRQIHTGIHNLRSKATLRKYVISTPTYVVYSLIMCTHA